jgi:hypothetical protein
MDGIMTFGEILGILKNTFKLGHVEHLGKGFYKIDLPIIICSGSDITQYFIIPFNHQLHRLELKHTDSSNADSTDALTYYLKYGSTLSPELLFTIVKNIATLESDSAHLFKSYWRSLSRYQLITNSTNTDKLYISLLVEIEG